MSNNTVRPSSIEGIKRLAKSIKRERGITHTLSLDEAARQGAFQNFRHAQNVLSGRGSTPRARHGQTVYITSYWRDRDGRSRGRETLKLVLSRPWAELVSRAELRHHRALRDFRGDAIDHLERQQDVTSQDSARDQVCAAARALVFMDATGVRPTNQRHEAMIGSGVQLPGLDHWSVWKETSTEKLLVVDEPYAAAIRGLESQREAWAARHGLHLRRSAWGGLYSPGNAVMELISDSVDGVSLDSIVVALESLPDPLVSSAWPGESAPYAPVFVTPGRAVLKTRKRERPSPYDLLRPYRNSIGYGSVIGGLQRRPDARMPLDAHERVATLLKGVLAKSYERKGVYNRCDRIRCDLDDWVQREYKTSDLPAEQFNALYYGSLPEDAGRLTQASALECHADLDQVRALVTQHYPDCAPRRSLLRTVGLAQGSLTALIAGKC